MQTAQSRATAHRTSRKGTNDDHHHSPTQGHPPSRRVLTVALAFGAGTALGVAGMALISRDHAVTQVPAQSPQPRRGRSRTPQHRHRPRRPADARRRSARRRRTRQHHRHRPPRPTHAQRQPRSPDNCRTRQHHRHRPPRPTHAQRQPRSPDNCRTRQHHRHRPPRPTHAQRRRLLTGDIDRACPVSFRRWIVRDRATCIPVAAFMSHGVGHRLTC